LTSDGSYPDWAAEVEMDGKRATCLDIDNAISDAAVLKGSEECNSLVDAFSDTCSYTIPTTPCDICPNNDVSPLVTVSYEGKEMKCSDIDKRLASREEADGATCTSAVESLQDCCFDQCHLCSEDQEVDPSLTIYYNGKTTVCSDVELIYSEKGVLASSEQCSVDQAAFSEDCCFTAPKTPCNICKRGVDYFDVMTTNSITFANKKQTCSDVSDSMFKRAEDDSAMCNEARDASFDICCDTKCSLCGDKGLDAGVQVLHEGRTMTCLELDLGLSFEEGSEQCSAITTKFSEQCCFVKPETPCRICPGVGQSVDTKAEVFYLGTNTTCENLSNYLGSREEQAGQTCQSATTDFADTCCYDQCSLCGEGKADWNTFVNYNGKSIACGDFEWILKGENVAADSDTCNTVKEEFFDKCCYEQPTTSCNLCQTGGKYLDVQPEVSVDFNGDSTTCINVYNSLFVREAADSDQCQEAKDSFAEDCCFEKCSLCQNGFIDTSVTVNVGGSDISCSALDLSFAQSVIIEGSAQCDTMRQDYAEACCYTMPDSPCRLCSGAYAAAGDVMVDFYGEQKTCSEISNKLAISEEAGSETCSSTQTDFISSCCYEKCPVCPTGSNLNWEVSVEYNKAMVSCGEFDTIIQSNTIAKGSQECNSILSIYSSPCCYNYATSTGGGSSTSEVTPPPPPPDVGFTQLESSSEGTIVLEKAVGDQVQTGDTVASVGSPTGDEVEVKATEDGYIAAFLTADGDNVADGDTVAYIATNEADVPTVQEYVQALATAEANAAASAASSAAPCSLCDAGEIAIDTDILFNDVQTSCLEVFTFLSTQTKAGSDTCKSGKEALQEVCCLKKCDICSGGGIPDWYANVNVNGNSLTCLELDEVIGNSQIEQGSDQCNEVLDVAAPACCYEPPTTPCNICQSGSNFLDVMSSVQVEYGGTTATCGQIFNALNTREEADSDTCSMVTADLASKCCYDKCSLCGDLQLNAAMSVENDGVKIGCSEFDSFIFASNMITEGTEECSAFQTEYRETCCYDVPCGLCSKGDKLYSIKEDASVTYGGTQTTCSDVSDFLAQEMSQSNNCLAAQENIFNDCCFQQCEMCPGAGETINWAATTTFNGMTQSCTDVYWMLVNDSIESTNPICSGVSQLAPDCCYKMPSNQCTLCRDDNGVTYNTRWIEEVTVGGVTKTCGDFNTLLSTQEADSQTYASAREEIFDACCFAGSDQLLATSQSNSIAISTDGLTASTDPNACQLCPKGQVGIEADINFNGNPTTCVQVYNFLSTEFKKVSESCASAQSQLKDSCCRDPSELKPGESAAFGEMMDGSGSVTSEPGKTITPPDDFSHLNAWTIKSSARGHSSFATLCTGMAATVALLTFFL
jgi:hypothetical protein